MSLLVLRLGYSLLHGWLGMGLQESISLAIGISQAILAMLNLARVRARDRPTNNHQKQLYTRTDAYNNHDRPITGSDLLSQTRSRVRDTARVLGVVLDNGNLAEGLDVVLFTGGEENDSYDREDGDQDGGDPPEDGEVLGDGVFLDEDCEHAGHPQEDVDAC